MDVFGSYLLCSESLVFLAFNAYGVFLECVMYSGVETIMQ